MSAPGRPKGELCSAKHEGTRVREVVPEAFAEALRELRLAGPEVLTGHPLTGGVSSDIWRVDTAHGPICAKRALPKLRVAADCGWRRSNATATRRAGCRWQPRPYLAPRVLGQHPRLGMLAMD